MFSESPVLLCFLKMSSTFISEDIERTAQVAMEVNEEFTSDHENTSSSNYKKFVETFKPVVGIVD